MQCQWQAFESKNAAAEFITQIGKRFIGLTQWGQIVTVWYWMKPALSKEPDRGQEKGRAERPT